MFGLQVAMQVAMHWPGDSEPCGSAAHEPDVQALNAKKWDEDVLRLQ